MYDVRSYFDSKSNEISANFRRGPGASDFRRQIYQDDLWVEPMADITGYKYFNFSCLVYSPLELNPNVRKSV